MNNMNNFNSDFSNGYFKALLDIYNYFTRNEEYDSYFGLNSKKKYKTHMFSFLNCLLTDSYIREEFMIMGGFGNWTNNLVVDTKTCEVKKRSGG